MIAGASRTSAATSCTSAIWSTNHGSNPLAAATSSTDAPAARACSATYSRPSTGVRRTSRSSSALRCSAGPVQNPATLVSVDRMALPSASGKLRPIDMTSPTLFIVVVSRGSAPGNFSNANRGILTTT